MIHIGTVSGRMRQSDQDEIMASSGITPFQALHDGFLRSAYCWTALTDNEPCAMFGVVRESPISNKGIPWLLATDQMRLNKKRFLIDGVKYMRLILEIFPDLYNFVDTRNKESIRWLKWLGFEILPAIKYGLNGELFHPFVLRLRNV